MHDHDHHAHHAHSHAHDAGRGLGRDRRLLMALVLIGVFTVVEFVYGWLSGSLALLADAGHMLTDTSSLALALTAALLSRRPADPRRSYGYERSQVLAAFVNGLALLGISLWIAVEAVLRLMQPVPIDSGVMLTVAVIGLAVNILAFFILSTHQHDNMNMRAATLHVISDLLGSLAAIVAALVLRHTGWAPVDPLLSLVACLLILRSGVQLTRQSAHVLLEGAPIGFDEHALRQSLKRHVPAVTDVHHVHAWMMDLHRPLLTLHATIDDPATSDQALQQIREHLRREYRYDHVTVQIEVESCGDAPCSADQAPLPH